MAILRRFYGADALSLVITKEGLEGQSRCVVPNGETRCVPQTMAKVQAKTPRRPKPMVDQPDNRKDWQEFNPGWTEPITSRNAPKWLHNLTTLTYG